MPPRRPLRKTAEFPLGMFLVIVGILVLALVAGLIAVVGARVSAERENARVREQNARTGQQGAANTDAVPPRAKQWQTVQVFTGMGNDNTPVFRIASNPWKIKWSAKAKDNAPAPKFEVNISTPTDAIGQAVNIERSGSGEYEVKAAPGQYELQIIATDMSWEIEVVDFR